MAERGASSPSTAAIPQAALVAGSAFGARLPARHVVAAIARGLRAGGLGAVDPCPLPGDGADLAELLRALDFDARMRRARAVVLAERRLSEETLAGSVAFEIATRARQAGVPSYAVAGENELNGFDARMLDLQLVIVAGSPRALVAAGRELAQHV